MNLSIVILNWNAADDTVACARRILAWKQLSPFIWVVDNASTDDSVASISGQCPAVRLIKSPVNMGFAGGTNQGISRSLATNDAPIMLLNNDAHIAEDDVIRLLDTLQENENIGLVGPLLFDAEQKDRLVSAGSKNPVLHHQIRVTEFDPAQSLLPVETIPGTIIIGRADVFQEVGLLDEAYFFSIEVADLCTRASKQGYLNVIDTRARGYHNLGRSSTLRDTLYAYYVIRNRFIYVRKFYRSLMKALLFSFWSGYSLALILKLYLSGKQAAAKAIYLALIDGWLGRTGGQNERVLAACQNSSNSLTSYWSGQIA